MNGLSNAGLAVWLEYPLIGTHLAFLLLGLALQ